MTPFEGGASRSKARRARSITRPSTLLPLQPRPGWPGATMVLVPRPVDRAEVVVLPEVVPPERGVVLPPAQQLAVGHGGPAHQQREGQGGGNERRRSGQGF